jgi:hypothetical protein
LIAAQVFPYEQLNARSSFLFALHATARIEYFKVSGNPSQHYNLQIFINNQGLMRQLINVSIIPTLTLDISDNNAQGTVEIIEDRPEQPGGLYI